LKTRNPIRFPPVLIGFVFWGLAQSAPVTSGPPRLSTFRTSTFLSTITANHGCVISSQLWLP
jgi:hypothetical protein